MEMIKPYSRRSFWLIFFWMLVLAGGLAAVVTFGKPHMAQKLVEWVKPEMPVQEILSQVHLLHDQYSLYLMAISAGLPLFFGLILWLVLKRTARRVLSTAAPAKPKASATPKKAAEQRRLENSRHFLHMLVVLQREGRLLDFFQEDLDMYEDEQIGAAVRDIHANCKKAMTKSLAMKPIIDESEGETFSVEAGFDPDAIKLTGRVTGEPPFTGIIRHKGWRAGKLDLPDLSAVKDPAIIAPAEVEIE